MENISSPSRRRTEHSPLSSFDPGRGKEIFEEQNLAGNSPQNSERETLGLSITH
jgi:hypothetical protein